MVIMHCSDSAPSLVSYCLRRWNSVTSYLLVRSLSRRPAVSFCFLQAADPSAFVDVVQFWSWSDKDGIRVALVRTVVSIVSIHQSSSGLEGATLRQAKMPFIILKSSDHQVGI